MRIARYSGANAGGRGGGGCRNTRRIRRNVSYPRVSVRFVSADFWTAVAAIAQLGTVGIAGWALVYARGQVHQARLTRERVAQPDVVVYVDRHNVRGYVDLVIKNFGQTTAYNVRLTLPPLQLSPYRNNYTGEEVKSLEFPKDIAVLAPGQEWRTVWESARRRAKYKGPPLQEKFVGRVEFDDKIIPDKPSYRNPVLLNIGMFQDAMWITEHKAKTVEKALYDIAGTLKSYKQEHDAVWVYTVPGDEERRYRAQLETDDEAAFDAFKAGVDRVQRGGRD